jgi:hypothetical protein
VHRLNLFPLLHLNVFHMIFNVLALTPLLERFENEFGTLVTLALFTGRKHCHIHYIHRRSIRIDKNIAFGTLPGGIYTLLEKFVLKSNTVVMGARYGNISARGTTVD